MTAFEWRCRRCRTYLCREDDLEQHHRSNGSYGQSHKQSRDVGGSCTSLFLQEPLTWMGGLQDTMGHLLCPGPSDGVACGVKLGAWNWSGNRCSCGSWVVPSISLVESKLDKRVAVAVDGSAGAVPSPPQEIDARSGGCAAAVSAVDGARVEECGKDEFTIVDRSKAFEEAFEVPLPPPPVWPAGPLLRASASQAGGLAVARALKKLAATASASAAAAAAAAVAEATEGVVPAKHRRRPWNHLQCGVHWFASAPPPACVVLLHAEGSSGAEAKAWADENWGGRLLEETKAAFLFPDLGSAVAADSKATTAGDMGGHVAGIGDGEGSDEAAGGSCSGDDSGGGGVSNVVAKPRFWFPRPQWDQGIGEEEEEEKAELDRMVGEVCGLVALLAKKGVPPHRVFLGGLGNGGELALHAGLRITALAQAQAATTAPAAISPAAPPPAAAAAGAQASVRALGGLFCIGGALPLSCSTLKQLQEEKGLASETRDDEGAPSSNLLPLTAHKATAPPLKTLADNEKDDEREAEKEATVQSSSRILAGGVEGKATARTRTLLPAPSSAASSCVVSWPPVLLCHARDDPQVPVNHGRATAQRLQAIHSASKTAAARAAMSKAPRENNGSGEQNSGAWGSGFSEGGNSNFEESRHGEINASINGGSEKEEEKTVMWLEYKGARHDGGVRTLARWINNQVDACL